VSTGTRIERRKANRKTDRSSILRIQLGDGKSYSRWVTADLREKSDFGVGITTASPLPVGSKILVRGRLRDTQTEATLHARVQWCIEQPAGNFHAGIEILTDEQAPGTGHAQVLRPQTAEADYYEIMQLSPNARIRKRLNASIATWRSAGTRTAGKRTLKTCSSNSTRPMRY